MKGYSFLVLLLLPALLEQGCHRAPGKDPLQAFLGFQASPPPSLEGLDWGRDPLWKAGGLVLRRAPFEAYLCERFAWDWIRTRAVSALFARGLYPGFPWKIRVPEAKVLALRAALAGKTEKGGEKALRRALLSMGWGEVPLLDHLRVRLLVQGLAGLAPEKKKVLPREVRALLEGALPPLLPSRLGDLARDGRAQVAALLAKGRIHSYLERREGGGTVLAWTGDTPLVRTEEILVDLLGVLTETERRRAFREYLALRMAEERLGKVCRVEEGAGRAEAWMGRVRAGFLASPEGKAPWPLLARAARKAAAGWVEGRLLLVPALRASSGRPGFPGDQKRALARARDLREELEGGRLSPGEGVKRLCSTSPGGWARRRVEYLAGFSGKALGLKDLEGLFRTPLDGLGLGGNPAWTLLLFSRKGSWTLAGTWWGPLLFEQEKGGKEGRADAAEVSALEGRMRFLAWCRYLLSGGKGPFPPR